MERTYDLAGRLVLSVDDATEGVASLVAGQMRPFEPSSKSLPADVEIRVGAPRAPGRTFLDVQNPARDGLVTASDGDRFYVVVNGRACSLPDPLRDAPLEFVLEPGFALSRQFGTLVRPAMHVALPSRGAVAVHSAAVELDGKGVLVAGWSETGKTETALALMEAGAKFLSDKWTVLGEDGQASAFPINIGVRRWVLPYLPRLNGNLPPAALWQLRAAAAASAASAPVRRRTGKSRIGVVAASSARRAVALADRVALTPDELRSAYGQADDPARRVPLAVVVLLTTVDSDDVAARPADPHWAAARLAYTAAYERRELFQALERQRYAFPLGNGSARETAVEQDRRLLGAVLERAQVIDVRTPFPVDPRRVADLVSPWL